MSKRAREENIEPIDCSSKRLRVSVESMIEQFKKEWNYELGRRIVEMIDISTIKVLNIENINFVLSIGYIPKSDEEYTIILDKTISFDTLN